MATTTTAWLSDLTTLFTPTASQFDGAKGHMDSIEARLGYVLGVHRMFDIGSLRHGTGVWQYSDAVYVISLKGIQPTSPQTMLTKVKEALQGRFTSTTITIRQPAVVCHFSDGVVEVVPGHVGAGGGYMIANPTGGWMKSFSEERNKYVDEIRAEHRNGGASKVVQHLTTWKYR
ncbi:hypothetical protein AB0O95_07010 [Rhodoglobus sp. NPDC076762]